MKENWLDHKQIVIASKHQKERVIQPLFLEFYNCSFITCDIDTDILGTFTGENSRTLTPYEACIEKCRMAFQQTDADFAIASEGSFGPHPYLFFTPSDEEFVLFMSRDEKLIIWAKELSTDTNYNSIENPSDEELKSFIENTHFPTHYVIFKSGDTIVKEISDEEKLYDLIHHSKENSQSFKVETDMRAHCNPTRMKVIEDTTKKLIEKLTSFCPSCNTPGFSIQDIEKGLPCAQCGLTTESTLKHIKICLQCDFKEEILFPRGVKTEDPTYCNFCNP